MSKSFRDGKKGGAYNCGKRYEVWSGRFHKVNYWTQSGKFHKKLTVRFERRVVKEEIKKEICEINKGVV